MRGYVAKLLRAHAEGERAGETGVNDRDLISVDKSGSLVNTPHSIRRLYRELKGKYKKLRARISTISWAEARKKGLVKYSKGSNKERTSHPQKEDRIMRIERPLELILQHCPPKKTPTGDIELHPIYRAARHAANRGQGHLVNKMAAQFLPA